MEKMIKGAVYYRRWFVPDFLGVRVFDAAAYDRFPFWQLFLTRRSLATTLKILWWTWALWAADRLPWFARKHAVNLIAGGEIYWDFHQSDRTSKAQSGDFGLRCIKW